MFWPDHGEYVNTTCFLSDKDAVERTHVECSTQVIAELALLTDGIERSVLSYAKKAVHEPFFDRNIQAVRLWREAGESQPLSEALADYLSGPEIRGRTDDDVTLVLATRRSLDEEGLPDPFLPDGSEE